MGEVIKDNIKSKEYSPRTVKRGPLMVFYELFVFKDAGKILESKGLLKEIEHIMLGILVVDHIAIQAGFRQSSWALEHYIFPDVSWK